MKLVLATGNKGKLREYRAMLEGTGIEVISQREAGFTGDVEENGTTFEENSLVKARTVADALGLACLADDSGLAVDALDGAPGIYSARYGGGGLTDPEKCDLLLHNMEGKTDRTARFVCVITGVFPDGTVLQARGECPGEIGFAPKGENGFGYDPVFVLPEKGKTMAQLPEEEKNSLSHRGRALEKFRLLLDEYRKEH